MPEQGSFKPDFEITVTPSDRTGEQVIEVCGELDSGSSEELLATVQSALTAGPSMLTLNLGGMTFIDSAGMRTLIMIERAAAGRNVALTVVPPPDEVTDLLRTAGLVDRDEPDADGTAAPAEKFLERTELELPRDPHSPARARAEVRDCVAGHDQSQLANIVLLTSELVTNAVVHPRGVGDSSIGLRVIVYGDRVRLEVEDSGEGFPHGQPVLPEGERGRGLFLVDRFSDRWGSGRVQTDAGPRFRVWFELGFKTRRTRAVA